MFERGFKKIKKLRTKILNETARIKNLGEGVGKEDHWPRGRSGKFCEGFQTYRFRKHVTFSYNRAK